MCTSEVLHYYDVHILGGEGGSGRGVGEEWEGSGRKAGRKEGVEGRGKEGRMEGGSGRGGEGYIVV